MLGSWKRIDSVFIKKFLSEQRTASSSYSSKQGGGNLEGLSPNTDKSSIAKRVESHCCTIPS
jgi:hypothetical protein